ncbi:MAG: FKBP-type peptidyl-prolyl cis-trans isomerase [Proteobacteria bacterium]|nr:FKBP-type peptidyl-prolyl cis-trans isomerase [Pseudomonadota bacterium]
MNILRTTFAVILSFTFISAQAAKIETDKEKLSYAMGFFFGQSVTRQDMDPDTPAFMQAVEDILTGAETKMTKDEMQQILSDYRKKEQQERVAHANNNKQDGIKYLEENKKKTGVTELESGLQYKVIKSGEGEKPTSEDTVVVHYRGTLIDGTEFDSSYARDEPAEFGVTRVIRGWQEALPLMTVGSKWQITVPSELAYGERGGGGVIGPNATLLFDIELIAIK